MFLIQILMFNFIESETKLIYDLNFVMLQEILILPLHLLLI